MEKEKLEREERELRAYKEFTDTLTGEQKVKLILFLGANINETNSLERSLKDIHEITQGLIK